MEDDEVKKEESNEDKEVEEYYLGKDRDEERKKKAYVELFACIYLLKDTDKIKYFFKKYNTTYNYFLH